MDGDFDGPTETEVFTKYLNFAKLNTGYIFTVSGAAVIPTALSFTTAGDAEARDPASYVLYGSNTAFAAGLAGTIYQVDTDFTEISREVLSLPSGRSLEIANVAVSGAAAYRTFLLVFPTLKDAATAEAMQIGEAAIVTAGGRLNSLQGTINGGVLSVVPEPSSAVLLALGTLALANRRRRI